MTQTILFVDEERYIHKALQRSFRTMRDEWEMHFANGPEDALQSLNEIQADVIVTETVFSGQNGIDFLECLRKKHPQVVRIILSGYSDQDVILKSVDLAHQYLSKPCDDEDLKTTIQRAFLMKELLAQGPLKKVVSNISSLPSLPALYVELVKELESEDASLQKVGDIIAKDIGLTAKILKLVNSAFFGLPQQITNPTKAVSLLGIDIIQAIVLTAGTFEKFNHLNFPGFSLEMTWQHAMTVASFAKIIAQNAKLDRKAIETAFMAGLLHDIGTLLMAAHLPDEFKQVLKLKEETSISTSEAEMSVVGTTHASVGAYLLGLWGLPDTIIDAAAFHHNPAQRPYKNLTPMVITHVADALAHAGPDLVTPDRIIERLDYDYLETANLLGVLEGWKQCCADHLDPETA